MLVSEDLALILTDNESGRMVASHAIRYGLAGAILCDLALQNFALVSHDEGDVRKNRIQVTHRDTDSIVLSWALEQLPRDDYSQYRAIERLKVGAQVHILDALVEQGLLRKKVGSVLGLVKSDRYPTVDPVPEREVRKELLATLEANESASPEMSALIGCIGMIGRAQHVVAEDLALGEAKSIKRRAQEYMNRNWGAWAARKAYEADRQVIAVS
ncbi:GOLPH3/VPS74 family protein [Granulicoccus phenolivorans]|uniref:GOLPH3/VPS74 family protein n=1 Tax=Granulicoccus phenolivorans TaxID=266854 RepID=UPI0004158E82|nr:GPP34 family phosphoprotein [Granulicoccus phenolivorans]